MYRADREDDWLSGPAQKFFTRNVPTAPRLVDGNGNLKGKFVRLESSVRWNNVKFPYFIWRDMRMRGHPFTGPKIRAGWDYGLRDNLAKSKK